jgi:hypothetical protein
LVVLGHVVAMAQTLHLAVHQILAAAVVEFLVTLAVINLRLLVVQAVVELVGKPQLIFQLHQMERAEQVVKVLMAATVVLVLVATLLCTVVVVVVDLQAQEVQLL